MTASTIEPSVPDEDALELLSWQDVIRTAHRRALGVRDDDELMDADVGRRAAP